MSSTTERTAGVPVVGASHVLEATDMSAGYGAVPVVRDMSLHVDRGEILALLGPNGAGKTTALLALAGELPLSAGSVVMEGTELTGPLYTRARRGMRVVTEDRSVFMGMSVTANLKLLHKDISPCLELFPELVPLLDRKAGLLSGGEQQMLTLARALTGEPKVVLIDELSLGLAPLIVQRLLAVIRSIADRGVAVILVEQQIRHALEIAHRGCVIRRGQIVLQGPASDLVGNSDEIERLYLGADVR